MGVDSTDHDAFLLKLYGLRFVDGGVGVGYIIEQPACSVI